MPNSNPTISIFGPSTGVLPSEHHSFYSRSGRPRTSGPISQLPLLLPKLDRHVSDWDWTVGGRRSEPKTESTSDESWRGTSLPLLRISASISSILWRCEIFNRSPPMSWSSSTLVRRSSPKSSDSAPLMEGKWGLCISSRTKDRKLFLEGFIAVQNTSRKLLKQPRS